MKWMRVLAGVLGGLRLVCRDCRDYALRLYVRASWAREGMLLARSALLQYESRRQVQVLGNCSVGSYSVIVAIDPTKKITPLLAIGDRSYLGDQVNIRAAGGVIRIGRDVLIANGVTIVAANHGMKLGSPIIDQPWERGDVSIEDGVWIGAKAVILPGSTVRQGAVIAAGAVVRGEVPSNAIYGGVPAKQIAVRSSQMIDQTVK